MLLRALHFRQRNAQLIIHISGAQGGGGGKALTRGREVNLYIRVLPD